MARDHPLIHLSVSTIMVTCSRTCQLTGPLYLGLSPHSPTPTNIGVPSFAPLGVISWNIATIPNYELKKSLYLVHRSHRTSRTGIPHVIRILAFQPISSDEWEMSVSVHGLSYIPVSLEQFVRLVRATGEERKNNSTYVEFRGLEL